MKYKALILGLVLFLIPVFVGAQERIKEFRSFITINEDASIDVAEEITYDFGTNERHGIYRDIPFKYKTSIGSYRAEISDVDVTTDEQTPGDFEQFKQDGDLRVKIGDPYTTISGVHTYNITYRVRDAISYFDDFDELYWNITGDGWSVPIDSVFVSVNIDGTEFTQGKCYRGFHGSTEECISGNGHTRNVYILNADALSSGEGVTIAVGFPKGAVYEPTTSERLLKILQDNWVLVLPLIVLITLFYLWYTRGKDPPGRGAIVPQYDAPKDLTPAEVSSIYNERVGSTDVSAELVYLAVRGYIKIHQIEKKKIIFTSTDYFLQKLKDADSSVTDFEKKLIENLFTSSNLSNETIEEVSTEGVLLSSLQNTFYKEFQEIQKDVYESVTYKGFFVKSPKKVRTAYGVTGFIVVFASIFLGGFTGSLLITISFALSGIFIAIFSFLMPVKTKQGVLSKEYILGLRDYIHTAERDRLAFHNDPEKTPERFDALLPFAMVLGVEKEWAKLFEGIYKGQPGWYSGSNGQAFSAGNFVSDIKGFSTAATSNLSSAPSSSGSGGGGSSGGGGGGGGGGSW